MENQERACPECGKPIFGRADKKFCSDSCRNSYNNKLHQEDLNYMRSVNSILRKNWKILKDLNKSGKTTTHREKLLKNGYDFNYCTNTYTTKAGDMYRFCYEQGIKELDNGFILIVRRDES